jgi:hypothetical protein
MPPIAPPDMPFFSVDPAAVGVLEALGVVVAETLVGVALESEDADREMGSEVEGVAVAWS